MVLYPTAWEDYALLDCGSGQKLERFGDYTLVRPEPSARWQPSLPRHIWEAADARFELRTPSSGAWQFRRPLPERWQMRYQALRFWVAPTPFRHVGVFPEQAVHWDWLMAQIAQAPSPPRLLSLFGYTGLATLAAAAAGAAIAHVDASKKAVQWARQNAELSGLADRPIRWLVDDALKFTAREVRRGARYEGFILDPPPFGRGAHGEIWSFEKSMPQLMALIRQLISPKPRCVVITAYTAKTSLAALQRLLAECMAGHDGIIEAGELGLRQQSAARILPTALYVRWRTTS
ncbi:MAG: SAM-dependent methyltransferase [Candidatus Thermofonsia Clade 1 bacterium]|jgi:23S rRNA (cytosine1962-C5)-methyltransferase|uniref:SAM-dependent methyltransferase n=1 Tax=Candidatus Thermofonsia Clade 1 bacterium TaxID=2364210 RepID=A0A2M8PFF6_9CHLR|nr:MAG: SAM-dependent methyltransferase [Candidatus Thermofonsia Clade 1 bacterium]RMF54044.1 MAG: class I SAM-dependent rRNA methyltransferase [Chloroflexota bacterium]